MSPLRFFKFILSLGIVHACYLLAAAAPVITGLPLSQTNTAGTTAVFSVSANGEGPLSFRWYWNGTNALSDGAKVSGAESPMLVISNVLIGDAGSFSVVVTDALGSVTSMPPAILTMTASTMADGPLFADDFVRLADPGPIPPWAVRSGNWMLTGGALTGGANTVQSYANVYLTNSWTDYSVEALIQFSSESAFGGGIGARLNPASGAHYAAWVYPAGSPGGSNVLKLIKFQTWTGFGYHGTSGAAMAQASVAPVGLDWHSVKLAIHANQIKVYYDGHQMLSVADTEPVPLSEGGICVDVWTHSLSDTMSISEVIVRPSVLEIPDTQLEAAVRSSLSDYTNITSRLDLSGLTCLWACNRQITNLDGLQSATNLVSLYLNDNAITDLNPLRGLTRLRELELYGNCIADLSSLAGLTKLTCLVLGGSLATNYSSLSDLTNLTHFTVREGGMRGMDFMTNLVNLSSLALWQNGIEDVSSLTGLTVLSRLDLRWNSITNTSVVLPHLTNLTSLYLDGTSLSNVPPLQKLGRLSLLSLSQNHISDLSPLVSLTNLTYLSANVNPISNLEPISNLPNLIGLELHGNSISNVGFMTALHQLNYANLAYNSISNLGPLASLPGLTSLVLAGNPVSDYSPLHGLTNLVNLWLHDNALTNAQFLTHLPWLNHLNLDHNEISDLSFINAFTNLTGLDLSRNPISNYSLLTESALPDRLTSLRLEGNCLNAADLASFISQFQALTFLSLSHNQIDDLTSLTDLNGLQALYLRRNGVHDPGPLTDLANLLEVDLSGNALDVNAGMTMSTIQDLQRRRIQMSVCDCSTGTNEVLQAGYGGVNVIYRQQSMAPLLFLNFLPPGFPPDSAWPIPCNATSTLPISAADGLLPDGLPSCGPLVVVASSSNPDVVSVQSVSLPNSYDNYPLSLPYFMVAESACGVSSDNRAIVTWSVTNQAGLGSSTNFMFQGVLEDCLTNLCPNLDSSLLSALGSAAERTNGCLTVVDLLRLATFTVQDTRVPDQCVWNWLTNLTSLQLGGIAISNLNFATNLHHLAYLSLNNAPVSDFAPLARLPDLKHLRIEHACLTNWSSLTNVSQLAILEIIDTCLDDVSWLGSLTNIQSVSLRRNLLTNIDAVASVPYLSNVDLRWNKLDLRDGSGAIAVIGNLTSQSPPITVEYMPQWSSPRFDVRTNWFVNAGGTNTLLFEISDEYSLTGLLPPGSSAFDSSVLHDVLVTMNQYPYWTLSAMVSPIQGSTNVGITLTVTNGAGLVGTTGLVVTVTSYLPVAESGAADDLLATADWLTSEDTAPWFGQTNVAHDGAAAVMSGAVGNRMNSWVETTAIGPGQLSFWWKVSCEANTDEETRWWPYDRLEFYLNGERLEWISGDVGWTPRYFDVGPGVQTFRWNYYRDNHTSEAYDAGWLDEVRFFPVKLELATNPGTDQVQLGVYGVPGKLYAIEMSTNLLKWVRLGMVTGNEKAQPFVDASAGPGPRFYRLRDVSIWLEQLYHPAGGVVDLSLHSPSGLDCAIEASTNLIMWSEVARITNTSGRAEFRDETIANSPQRFYRAVVLP